MDTVRATTQTKKTKVFRSTGSKPSSKNKFYRQLI